MQQAEQPMSRRRRKREPGVASRHAATAAGTAISRWLVLVLFAVVAIGVAAAHWPALSAEAQCFDDGQYLTDNPLIQNPSWNSAWRFLTEVFEPSTVGGYYEPLDMISLMLDYAMTGRADMRLEYAMGEPLPTLRPFHRTSLLLHVLNSLLVSLLVLLLFRNPWVAALAGLLFGVHPLTVEPIPWVGQRKTLLAAFFSLCCLCLYVLYATRASNAKGRKRSEMALSGKPRHLRPGAAVEADQPVGGSPGVRAGLLALAASGPQHARGEDPLLRAGRPLRHRRVHLAEAYLHLRHPGHVLAA